MRKTIVLLFVYAVTSGVACSGGSEELDHHLWEPGCRADEDCPEGQICSHSQGDECVIPLEYGDWCPDSDVCAEGLVCREDLQPGRCFPLGERGEVCGSNEGCREPLVCVTVSHPPECQPAPGLGDLCSLPTSNRFFRGCALEDPSVLCNLAIRPHRCSPGVLPEGAPCPETTSGDNGEWNSSHDLPNRPLRCDEGLSCNTSFEPPLCLPPGDEGDFCSWHTDCREGLRCNFGIHPSICSAPAPLNAFCGSERDCAASLICLLGLDVPYCSEPLEAGMPCPNAIWQDPCGAGLLCTMSEDNPTCEPSDMCRDDWNCPEDQFCYVDRDVWMNIFGVCTNIGEEGSDCFQGGDADCAPGYHCEGSDFPQCTSDQSR